MESSSLQLKGLRKRQLTQLASKARTLGMTAETYVRRLVERDLALDDAARNTSLRDLFGNGRNVDEAELDRLVDAAKARHHVRLTRKK